MKKYYICFAMFIFFSIHARTKTPYLDLNAYRQEQYQDIIINGKVVSKGKRACESRYEAIKPILAKYKRPFTILDIGASQGYFSLRASEDFDAHCVMIEGNYNNRWKIADQLQDICRLNTDRNTIIFLKKRITIDELIRLGECEHFDVVLVFNVLHHLSKTDWKRACDAVFTLGDNIIVETPPANDSIAKNNKHIVKIEQYMFANNGVVIAETPRHTSRTKGKMFWFERHKSEQQRFYWQSKKEIEPLAIKSDYKQKSVFNIKTQTWIPWYCGIKKSTFNVLNGTYPTRKMLREAMQQNNVISDLCIIEGIKVNSWFFDV